MKRYVFTLLFLLIATCANAQYNPTIGSPNNTVRVKGGIKIDSGLQCPLVDPTTKNTGKGLDTNSLLFSASTDTLPRWMKNGVVMKIMTAADSNTADGYATIRLLDSIALITIGDTVNIYNSDGSLTGPRTVNCAGYFLDIRNANPFNVNGPIATLGNVLNQLSIDSATGESALGDVGNNRNRTVIRLNDSSKTIGLNANNTITIIGNNNGNYISLDDTNQIATLKTFLEIDLHTLALLDIQAKVTKSTSGYVNTAIKSFAYGTTDTIVHDDGTYDIGFTGDTGAVTLYLPLANTAPIGTEYIISDWDGVCFTYNITIDAGAGNIILPPGFPALGGPPGQTYVMLLNYQTLRLKKILNTTWKCE